MTLPPKHTHTLSGSSLCLSDLPQHFQRHLSVIKTQLRACGRTSWTVMSSSAHQSFPLERLELASAAPNPQRSKVSPRSSSSKFSAIRAVMYVTERPVNYCTALLMLVNHSVRKVCSKVGVNVYIFTLDDVVYGF